MVPSFPLFIYFPTFLDNYLLLRLQAFLASSGILTISAGLSEQTEANML